MLKKSLHLEKSIEWMNSNGPSQMASSIDDCE